MTTPLPVNTWAFLLVCASAGALAVPPDAVGTSVSAGIAALMGFAGLYVWRWSRLPLLMQPDAKHATARFGRLAMFFVLGLLVGLVLLAAIRLIVEPIVPAAGARIEHAGTLPLWRRAVIVYVAAVSEEIVFRLLMLSMIAGLAARAARSAADALPDGRIMWAAIALSAAAFAAFHLPAWTAIGPLGVGLAFSVLTLNAVAGAVSGYVFVQRGILAAICVHAGGDCAIQFIGPLTG